MFKRILIPIDTANPELARPALAQAAELATASGGLVRLIYVRPFPIEAALASLPQNIFDEEEKSALSVLDEMAQTMRLPPYPVPTLRPTRVASHPVVPPGTAVNTHLIANP